MVVCSLFIKPRMNIRPKFQFTDSARGEGKKENTEKLKMAKDIVELLYRARGNRPGSN